MPSPNAYTLSDCQRDAYRIAQQYGLPGNLLFSLAVQESSCRPSANGSSGEKGLTQILPGTFAQFGCSGNPYNPIDAFNCTGKILSFYSTKYSGSPALELGAYNAGAGNVIKCRDGSYAVPRSTAQYLYSILQRAGIPVDKVIKSGACSAAQNQPPPPGGQPAPAPAPGGVDTSGLGSGISGTLSLPNARAIIIYGLALILIIFAATKLR